MKTASVLLATFAVTAAQVYPAQYIFDGTISSVNGSSDTGNCSDTTPDTCLNPTSSVLFDQDIPTLTGLDGNMWASQLLTINMTSGAILAFNFAGVPNFTRITRVEMVIFNCKQWDISLNSTIQGQAITPTENSCDSLVRVCTSINPPENLSFLSMELNPSARWVHIAEITFLESGDSPNTTITTPPPDTTTPTPLSDAINTIPTSPSDTIPTPTPTPTSGDSTASPRYLVLWTVLFMLLQIGICKCHYTNFTPGVAQPSALAEREVVGISKLVGRENREAEIIESKAVSTFQ